MALPQQCRTLADDDYIGEALRLQQGGRVNMILIACVVPLGLQAQPGHRGHLTLMAALHVPVQEPAQAMLVLCFLYTCISSSIGVLMNKLYPQALPAGMAF